MFSSLCFRVVAEIKGNHIGIINPWMRPLPTSRLKLITNSKPNGYFQSKHVSSCVIAKILLSFFIKSIFWGFIVQGHNNHNQLRKDKIFSSKNGSIIRISHVLWVGYFQPTSGRNYKKMPQPKVEELVAHLEGSLEISSMEQGVKLVGAISVDQPLNKWGVRNILRSFWRKYVELQINWVKDNVYII